MTIITILVAASINDAFAFSRLYHHMILSFILVMWCVTLIYLLLLNCPCFPGVHPTWSWSKILQRAISLL